LGKLFYLSDPQSLCVVNEDKNKIDSEGCSMDQIRSFISYGGWHILTAQLMSYFGSQDALWASFTHSDVLMT
jgi:hypothetical protein